MLICIESSKDIKKICQACFLYIYACLRTSMVHIFIESSFTKVKNVKNFLYIYAC